jgi:hypothetical protein
MPDRAGILKWLVLRFRWKGMLPRRWTGGSRSLLCVRQAQGCRTIRRSGATLLTVQVFKTCVSRFLILTQGSSETIFPSDSREQVRQHLLSAQDHNWSWSLLLILGPEKSWLFLAVLGWNPGLVHSRKVLYPSATLSAPSTLNTYFASTSTWFSM